MNESSSLKKLEGVSKRKGMGKSWEGAKKPLSFTGKVDG